VFPDQIAVAPFAAGNSPARRCCFVVLAPQRSHDQGVVVGRRERPLAANCLCGRCASQCCWSRRSGDKVAQPTAGQSAGRLSGRCHEAQVARPFGCRCLSPFARTPLHLKLKSDCASLRVRAARWFSKQARREPTQSAMADSRIQSLEGLLTFPTAAVSKANEYRAARAVNSARVQRPEDLCSSSVQLYQDGAQERLSRRLNTPLVSSADLPLLGSHPGRFDGLFRLTALGGRSRPTAVAPFVGPGRRSGTGAGSGGPADQCRLRRFSFSGDPDRCRGLLRTQNNPNL
jgi:hypothetical protein